MKRRQFRLVLEAQLDASVRLTQVHHYATDLVGGRRELIAPALSEYLTDLFPAKEPKAVLEALVGKAPIGWRIEPQGTKESRTITIVTEGPGAALSTIIRIIEQILPNSLTRPMTYEPISEAGTAREKRHLH